MNARKIVKEYLKKHGYDGLFSDNCGCSISDLILCDEDFSECKPAVISVCDGKGDCECEAGENHYGPRPEGNTNGS